jgi:hypothetical protein
MILDPEDAASCVIVSEGKKNVDAPACSKPKILTLVEVVEDVTCTFYAPVVSACSTTSVVHLARVIY